MAEQNRSLMVKIRCSHQKYGDFNLEVKLDWSVRDLKTHLSQAYPSKPDASLQRLVFAGQLMKDAETVASYLNRLPDIELPIIHLVYTPNLADQRQKTPPPPSTEFELRRRKTAAPPSGQNPVPSSTAAPPSGQNSTTPNDDVINGGATVGSADQQFFAGAQNFVQPGFNTMHAQHYPMNHPYVNQYFQYLQQLYGPMYWPYGNFAANSATAVATAGGTNFASFFTVPQMFPGTAGTGTGLPANFTQVASAAANFANVPQAAVAQVVADGTQAVPAVPQNLPQQGAVVPQPPQRDLAMNAQGGVAEDDDEGRNRDWLDYVYTAARAGLLFVILYSYSSMERLTFVLICCGLLYGFQAGWFTRRRPAPQNNAAQANNQSQPAPPPATTNQQPAPPSASTNQREAADASPTPPTEGGENFSTNQNAPPAGDAASSTNQIQPTTVTDPNSQSAWHVFWSTCYIFISSFFASLIPERPPPVNLN